MAVASLPKTTELFAQDTLKCHNDYRKKHGVPELTLNEKLCQYAQEWADKCAKSSKMQHRDPSCPYGENIYYFSSSDPNQKPKPDDVVKEWYEEIKNHKFGEETVNMDTLHFTQVIWKASKNLGIAMADNEKKEYYVVANYDPKGNFAGQFVENVPPPKK